MDPQQQANAEINFPTVGRWQATALPSGWIYVADFGIRQMPTDAQGIFARISLGQDELTESNDLATYIADQTKLIANHLTDSARAGPQPMTFPGAEEAWLLFIRHTSSNSVRMLHAQTYVRQGSWVGIIILTTRESELQAVRTDYEAFVKGLRITPA